jgi:hypothetical protein
MVAVKVAVSDSVRRQTPTLDNPATVGKQAIAGDVGISKDPSSNRKARDTSRRSHASISRICKETL